jgi:hypothetical protein
VDDDALLSVEAFDDARAVKLSGIGRLPAAGRVKGRAVEDDAAPACVAVPDGDDAGVEFREMRVCVVESFGWHARLNL